MYVSLGTIDKCVDTKRLCCMFIVCLLICMVLNSKSSQIFKCVLGLMRRDTDFS